MAERKAVSVAPDVVIFAHDVTSFLRVAASIRGSSAVCRSLADSWLTSAAQLLNAIRPVLRALSAHFHTNANLSRLYGTECVAAPSQATSSPGLCPACGASSASMVKSAL